MTYESHRSTRFDDATLRSERFRIHDPESTIKGLDRSKPDTNESFSIIGFYDETPPGGRKHNPEARFVWCCHCQKETHWKGYVIQNGKGAFHILGAEGCGQKHFGVGFDTAETGFKQRQARQKALLRIDSIVEIVPQLQIAIDRLLEDPNLIAVERAREQLKRNAPAFWGELTRRIEKNSPLTRHRQERDYEAEDKRAEKYRQAVRAFQHLPSAIRSEWRREGLAPVEDCEPIYRSRTDHFGLVSGGEFLLDSIDLRDALLNLKRQLRAAKETSTNSASATTAKLQRCGADFDRHLSQVRNLGEAVKRCLSFFSADNLDRIRAWAEGLDEVRLVVSEGALKVSEAGRPALAIGPLGAISTKPIDDLSSSMSR